jgi:hypothetical protein
MWFVWPRKRHGWDPPGARENGVPPAAIIPEGAHRGMHRVHVYRGAMTSPPVATGRTLRAATAAAGTVTRVTPLVASRCQASAPPACPSLRPRALSPLWVMSFCDCFSLSVSVVLSVCLSLPACLPVYLRLSVPLAVCVSLRLRLRVGPHRVILEPAAGATHLRASVPPTAAPGIGPARAGGGYGTEPCTPHGLAV